MITNLDITTVSDYQILIKILQNKLLCMMMINQRIFSEDITNV